MNRPIAKAVMFDLDGTLMDTAPDLVKALNQLREERGHSPLPNERVRASVSNGAWALIELGFAQVEPDADKQALRERLLEIYGRDIAQQTRLFPGMGELLQWLQDHDIGWGIATNKPWLYTRTLLERLALQPAPDIVICPDHVTHRKPDPESLLVAAQHFDCEPAELVYLGDHRRDIECGRAAGSHTIACGFGYIEPGDDPTRWGADQYLAHSEQVSEAVTALFTQHTD